MWSSERLRDARLNALTDLVSTDIDRLFAELGIEARRRGKRYVGPCPVHNSDNPTSFHFYPEGSRVRGIWRCLTRDCHLQHKETLIGLVRAVLSTQSGRNVSFWDAVHWVCRFAGVSYNDITVDISGHERRAFIGAMELLAPQMEEPRSTPIADIASRLTIPSPYFLSRGYSQEVLKRYLVGEPREENPRSPFHRRAVVPVFSEDGRGIIGYTGRSLFAQCKDCHRWHGGTCPSQEYRHGPRYAKWRHSDNLPVRETLYNLHSARHEIRRTGKVVLVEGPGDVWRLEEAGLHNAVAVFGKTLEDPQQVLLEKLGVTTVVLMLDADEAGRAGNKEIIEILRTVFHLRIVSPPRKDVGEMSEEEVRRFLCDESLLPNS